MSFEARLCGVVEGVMFAGHHAGRLVRGLVPRDTLEQLFGAGSEPESWLQAYHRHASTIERVACEQHGARAVVTMLVLRPPDFADLEIDRPPPRAGLAAAGSEQRIG